MSLFSNMFHSHDHSAVDVLLDIYQLVFAFILKY